MPRTAFGRGLTLAGLSLPLLLLTAPTARAADEAKPPAYEVEVIKDLAYDDGPDGSGVHHKLDLYLPKGTKDFPVLFFVHGGAWRHGDKNYFGVGPGLGKFYASHGVGFVSINYRLSPAVQHPEHIKDVARAFAWTHKNIGRYGGRPDQMIVCGHSAGGHLVALLATDESYLKAEGLGVKDIKAVIPISGVYVLAERFMPQVFGADGQKQAAPINHVRAGLPPFLILYADHDMPGCDKRPSEAFCKALKDKGVAAETCEITDSNHFTIIVAAAAPDDRVSTKVLDFIRAQTEKR
jgi:acetyl esterase/lipase